MKINYSRRNFWIKKSVRLQTWISWMGIATVVSVFGKIAHNRIVPPEESETDLERSKESKRNRRDSRSSKRSRNDSRESSKRSRGDSRRSSKRSRNDSRRSSRKSDRSERSKRSRDSKASRSRKSSTKSQKVKQYEDMLNEKFKVPEKETYQDGEDQMEYLERRIQSLEGMIEQMKQVMVDEASKRINMIQDFEEKEKKVIDYLEREEMNIGKKVQKELKKYLEASAQEYNELKKEKEEIENKYREHLYLAAELDSMVIQFHTETKTDKDEIKMLNELVEGLKEKIKEQDQAMVLKEGENLEKTDTIKKLTKELNELKGVIYKLSDVRNVLNRVLDPYSNDPDEMMEQLKNENEALNNDHAPLRGRGNNDGFNRGNVNRAYNGSGGNEDFWYAANPEKSGSEGIGFLNKTPNFFDRPKVGGN